MEDCSDHAKAGTSASIHGHAGNVSVSQTRASLHPPPPPPPPPFSPFFVLLVLPQGAWLTSRLLVCRCDPIRTKRSRMKAALRARARRGEDLEPPFEAAAVTPASPTLLHLDTPLDVARLATCVGVFGCGVGRGVWSVWWGGFAHITRWTLRRFSLTHAATQAPPKSFGMAARESLSQLMTRLHDIVATNENNVRVRSAQGGHRQHMSTKQLSVAAATFNNVQSRLMHNTDLMMSKRQRYVACESGGAWSWL